MTLVFIWRGRKKTDQARATFHLSSGHVGTGLVLERDPRVDGAALQAGGGGAAGAPAEVVREVLRSLDRASDGVGVHSEESVERGVARDGPAEAGQADLRSGAAGQGWGGNISVFIFNRKSNNEWRASGVDITI